MTRTRDARAKLPEAHADPADQRPEDGDLALPAAWVPPSRPPVPLLASAVPVLGAVALWLATGSALVLWLAALGPIIALATVADAARSRRSERRRANATMAEARMSVEAALARRHDEERRRLRRRHPDAAALLARDDDIWRSSGDPGDIVAGRGDAPSSVRVTGGDESALDLRRAARTLTGAPIVVAADAGIAVVGTPVLADAVQRALVLQLCLTHPPGDLRIADPPRDPWSEALPHRRVATGRMLAFPALGEPVPVEADIVVARAVEGSVPPRCAAVLRVDSPDRAVLEQAGERRMLAVEAVAQAQARAVAESLAERAGRVMALAVESDPVTLSALLAAPPPRVAGALSATFAVGAGEPVAIDLVADGPHAVVAGITGSGKSELLISWVLALCATHSTEEVNFLLADFKGGTAFDPLRAVPHVTGVITDLDGSGARRAIESLRAEVRWREGELARVGARDVLDPRVELPRLVVVVDEFAALLGDHPELNVVFSDIAARGRALGMHLVLGTQRVTGVVRDALLANCPLRISLRVADQTDSRAVIGTDAAAELPGGSASAGIAFVRRASDVAPRRMRVALASPVDVQAVVASAAGPVPRRPWLPDLPTRVDLAELRGSDPRARVLGIADDPARQRQPIVEIGARERGILVVGGPGAGKTIALDVLSAQSSPHIVRVPRDLEAAWDAVHALVDDDRAAGDVLIDDLDELAARYPGEYALAFAETVERLVRGSGASGRFVAISAQRLTGAAGRVADLLPRRLLLATTSRAEHIAAGGDPAHYAPDAPPGRGRLDGRAIQTAFVEPRSDPEALAPAPFVPAAGEIIGFAARRSAASGPAAVWRAAGVQVVPVEEGVPQIAGGAAVVVVGDPDEWQRQWRLLGDVREEHGLLIDAGCAAEYRILGADRTLPPYCEPGRRRAWLVRGDAGVRRVALPVTPRRRREA